MCSNYSQDNKQTESNERFSSAGQPLTFQDWKAMKDRQIELDEKLQFYKRNNKPASNNRSSLNSDSYARNMRSASNSERHFQFVAGNNRPVFMHPINFNGITINQFLGMRRNNFGSAYNSLDYFKSKINSQNLCNNLRNRLYNFDKHDNLSNCNTLTRSFREDCNDLQRSNQSNNVNLPDCFFASDGIYRQKDMMQKPLINSNPFRNHLKANQLLQEFDKSRYSKEKKMGKKTPAETKKTNSNSHHRTGSGSSNLGSTEAKVYVPNPKGKIDGKPYIPKPKVPEKNLEISREEKRKQWKEYREAMKPFKNRDFYNAKRVVQRLGKIAPNELDEKQLIRLKKSREIVAAHKARLSAKYPNYIKSDDSCNDTGEVYVLKKKPLTDSACVNPTSQQESYCGSFDGSTTLKQHIAVNLLKLNYFK